MTNEPQKPTTPETAKPAVANPQQSQSNPAPAADKSGQQK